MLPLIDKSRTIVPVPKVLKVHNLPPNADGGESNFCGDLFLNTILD